MGPRIPKISYARMETLRDEAGRESLKRIAMDMERASWKVRKHLEYIQSAFFSPGFEVNDLLSTQGLGSASAVDFHREMGTSIRDYVDRERVASAARLLARVDLSLEYAAELLGFGDRSVLSNAFERHTGLRPTAFRKRWKEVVARVGAPAIEVHNLSLIEDFRAGKLDATRARLLLNFFERLARSREEPSGSPLAETTWNQIKDHQPDVRFVWVRDILRFNRPAFYFLLDEKMRLALAEGITRESLFEAFQWTYLAMVHVDGNAKELGDKESAPLRTRVLQWLVEVRGQAETFKPPILSNKSQLWLDLVEGRLHLAQGETPIADQLFRNIRWLAVRQRWSVEASMACLGLAGVITRVVQPGATIASLEVADLVSQALPALQDLTDHAEARALLQELGDALRQRALTPEMIRATRRCLERLSPSPLLEPGKRT